MSPGMRGSVFGIQKISGVPADFGLIGLARFDTE
jgi:hypothetical protein